MRLLCLPAGLTFLLIAVYVEAQTPAAPSTARASVPVALDKLGPHPRLHWTAPQIAALRERLKADPEMATWHKAMVARGQKMLDEPPVEHTLIGPRLLNQSRAALGRVSLLAGLYRIDGEGRYRDRAIKEMLVACAFADWNPSHFLDVAEMTNAMAIGYDWLYDDLSKDDRAKIRAGIVNLGLKPGLEGFENGIWWTKATHNWAQVCNGGLTAGALAVGDEEPELAARLVGLCRDAIAPSMHAYAPDGGFPEGPGYWSYATAYNCYYLSEIESALHTDFGLAKMPGFDKTGYFRVHCVGPTGKSFNYADAGEGIGPAAEMFYLGRLFKNDDFSRDEAARAATAKSLSIFHLIWYARPEAQASRETPLDAHFIGVNVAFFRSAWADPGALFVGFKGGDNGFNHSHLDLGSFVLDSQGKRFASDLGSDDYNLPGYFGKQRWSYYRLRTESHNTITLDSENQAAKAAAPIIAFVSGKDRSHAVADLTAAWPDRATRYHRGIAMLDRSAVLVQDELELSRACDVRWNFVTASKIAIDGPTATLTQGEAVLKVRIVEPKEAAFEVVSANPPAPQKQQPAFSNLTIKLPGKVATTRIVVWIGRDAGPDAIQVVPLEKWARR